MDVHVEIAAETLFDLGPIPVTNSMLTMFIVMGLLILAGWLIARNAKEVPSRSQSILEMIVEFLLGLVESTAGRKLGRQIFPLVGGLFIFILFANYSGLLPGVGTIGVYRTEEEAAHTTAATGSAASSLTTLDQENGSGAAEEEEHKVLVPFLRAPNADLNMTLAMALVTFTAVQILGIRAHGVGGRIRHMADPPFLFPIELVSELSRII